MKAIVQHKYGGPEVLEMLEVDKPSISDNDILIEVHYANIASGDMRVNTLGVTGILKFIMRLLFGWNKPRRKVRGISGSGKIVESGSRVSNFKVGDRVYFINSMKAGVLAEYLKLPSNGKVVTIPDNVSYEDAAPMAFGALTAMHFMNEKNVTEDDEILIYGASGSVGSYAVQLAKFYGGTVTAVCSEKNRDVMKSIGADNVIDYKTTDIKELLVSYDVIFDSVMKLNKSEVSHLLNANGKYLSTKSPTTEKVELLLKLNRIMSDGKIKSVIEKIYDFDEFREAHEHVYTGHKVGNVLVKIKGSE